MWNWSCWGLIYWKDYLSSVQWLSLTPCGLISGSLFSFIHQFVCFCFFFHWYHIGLMTMVCSKLWIWVTPVQWLRSSLPAGTPGKKEPLVKNSVGLTCGHGCGSIVSIDGRWLSLLWTAPSLGRWSWVCKQSGWTPARGASQWVAFFCGVCFDICLQLPLIMDLWAQINPFLLRVFFFFSPFLVVVFYHNDGEAN